MPEPSEFQKLKERVHNINDWKQEHMQDMAVLAHRVNELEAGRHDYATKEHLTSSIDAIKEQLKSVAVTVSSEIGHLKDDIRPLKNAIYWAATVVIGAVILAGLALILKGPAL